MISSAVCLSLVSRSIHIVANDIISFLLWKVPFSPHTFPHVLSVDFKKTKLFWESSLHPVGSFFAVRGLQRLQARCWRDTGTEVEARGVHTAQAP